MEQIISAQTMEKKEQDQLKQVETKKPDQYQQKEKKKREKREKKEKPIPTPLFVHDITHFFTTSDRSGNDEANKIRERILQVISTVPLEFIANEQYGPLWQTVHDKWEEMIRHIAVTTHISEYTHTTITMYGGRTYHYDAMLSYYHHQTCVATRKIEFKNGGTTVDELPQFLSLQTKCGLLPFLYELFYYERYLDQYLACDSGITEPKPTLQVYQKQISKTKYSCLPFFAQLKERETINVVEKKEIVNRSITDYLEQYGAQINVDSFYQKVASTQQDKLFIMWSQGMFHMDTMTVEPMTFHSIVNGNVIQLQSGATGTMYRLLLRWRNHKGVLNPAFQISMIRNKQPQFNPSLFIHP